MALCELFCTLCNEPHDEAFHTMTVSASHLSSKSDLMLDPIQAKAAKDTMIRSYITAGTLVWVPDNSHFNINSNPDVGKLTDPSRVKTSKKAKLKGNDKPTNVDSLLEPKMAECWVTATVLSRCGAVITVSTNDFLQSLRVIDLSDPRQSSQCLGANHELASNMTALHFTHEPAVLYNLRLRSKKKQPYTFIGGVLVSINPLQNIEPKSDEKYDDDNGREGSPHPKTIAERAYRKMAFAISQLRRLREKSGRVQAESKFGQDNMDTETQGASPTKESLINKESNFAKQYGMMNQSILISGESGSGKTEAAKRVLCHLVEREGYGELGLDRDQPELYAFQDKLLGADPILESFGNAKTLRNPNSSRFGKFLKLSYEPDDDYPDELILFGASITTYLLEKSRVTNQEAGEKNFRIFYQLLTAPNQRLHKYLGFKQAGYCFTYLGSSVFRQEDRDRNGYVHLRTALLMAKLGIRSIFLYQIVAGILHLGNLEFVPETTQEGEVAKLASDTLDFYESPMRKTRNTNAAANKRRPSVRRTNMSRQTGQNQRQPSIRATDKSRLTRSDAKRISVNRMQANLGIDITKRNSSYVNVDLEMMSRTSSSNSFMTEDYDIQEISMNKASQQANNYDPMKYVCKLLGVSRAQFTEMLTHRVVGVGNERILKGVDVVSAYRQRDAVAKHIYALLFEWIVQRLNENLYGEPNSDPDMCPTSFIGVLDVFGFEEFEKNGFEQLLINYANEVLLSLFTREILIGESEIYKQEGLVLQAGELPQVEETSGKYQECLNIYEGFMDVKAKRPGLFSIIDTHLKIPSSSEFKMLDEIKKTFSKKNAAFFIPPRSTDTFAIKHYASDVTYTVGSFLEKNDQSLPKEIEQLFSSSTQNIIKTFPKMQHKNVDSKGKKQGTVGSTFHTQMEDLKDTLLKTACSYIRCVKPNPTLFFKEDLFNIESHFALMEQEKVEKSESSQEAKKKQVNPKLAAEKMHRTRLLSSQRRQTIVPNKSNVLKANQRFFNTEYVSQQLRNLGIFDCVNVLKAGLPTRIPYPSFVDTFAPVFPFEEVPFFQAYSNNFRQRIFVNALMEAFKIKREHYKLGNTKIFFKNGQLEYIKEILRAAQKFELFPNGNERSHIVKRFFKFYSVKMWKVTFSRIIIKSTLCQLLHRVRSIRKIQIAFRHYIFRRNLRGRIKLGQVAVLVQKIIRGFITRRRNAEIIDQLKKKRLQSQIAKSLEKAAKVTVINTGRQKGSNPSVQLEIENDPNNIQFPDRLVKNRSVQEMKLKAEQDGNSVTGTDKTPSNPAVDIRSSLSTFYSNNAMRNNLQSYFTRQISITRKSRNRSSSFSFIGSLPSKLSNADSLFNSSTVEGASEAEWTEIDYAFLDLEGEDPEFDGGENFDTFSDQDEELYDQDEFDEKNSSKRPTLKKSKNLSKLTELAELEDLAEIHVNPAGNNKATVPNRPKKKTRKSQKMNKLQAKKSSRTHKSQRSNRTVASNKTRTTNISTRSMPKQDEDAAFDEFAEKMFDEIKTIEDQKDNKTAKLKVPEKDKKWNILGQKKAAKSNAVQAQEPSGKGASTFKTKFDNKKRHDSFDSDSNVSTLTKTENKSSKFLGLIASYSSSMKKKAVPKKKINLYE